MIKKILGFCDNVVLGTFLFRNFCPVRDTSLLDIFYDCYLLDVLMVIINYIRHLYKK